MIPPLQDILKVEMETHGSASDRIVKLVDLQKSSWRKRVELYESIKNRTSNTIDIEFTKKLKVGRNWKGSIDINHDDQLVYIKVAPVKGMVPVILDLFVCALCAVHAVCDACAIFAPCAVCAPGV